LGGRPKVLPTPAKVAMAQALYDDQQHRIADICKTLGLSRATLYRYLKPGTGEHPIGSEARQIAIKSSAK
jgi:ACT domain-containing protein